MSISRALTSRALTGNALLRFPGWIMFAWILIAPSISNSGEPRVELGSTPTSEHIERLSITIFPDGRNLPNGHGTARVGAELYRGRCAACHGDTGTEGPAARLVGSDGFFGITDPLRPLRIRKHPLLVMSVGAQWPHATTIFDYVRRAMPHHAPKSLTNEEVYALTAYVLYLNDLIEEDTVVDRELLPMVEMPGRARSVQVWKATD